MRRIKNIGKAFIVAFSIYSKIPMPSFEWKSEDMQYHLFFFPWVGAVIGGLEWALFNYIVKFCQNPIFTICMAVAIPLLITGGFHVDGFLDTCDALHSYQDREKKLEILKDPHIGAFAVICLVTYLLLLCGFLSVIENAGAVSALCFGFFLSRILSGISVVKFPTAKKDGMLRTFMDTAAAKVVFAGLILQLIVGSILMVFISGIYGSCVLGGILITFLYYYVMSKNKFGGITGDIAGYFVTVSELVMVICAAAASCFM